MLILDMDENSYVISILYINTNSYIKFYIYYEFYIKIFILYNFICNI